MVSPHNYRKIFSRAARSAWLLLTISLAMQPLYSQNDLMERLKLLPEVEVHEKEAADGFKQHFEIFLTMPLDHQNPDAGTFRQRLLLSHLDFQRPLVFVTEGYWIFAEQRYELSRLLNANQLRLEHRFYGKSRPDSLDWQYLNIRQAAEDQHMVRELFKKIYPSKWITTGSSKGGQTALFYRYFYPDDVDATVAYVAPIPLAAADRRLDEFLATVGDAGCRQKIKDFQRMTLKHRAELRPLLQQWAVDNDESFGIGLDAVLEYAALEYSFSFWQGTPGNCDGIPEGDASAAEIFEHLTDVVGLSLYSDAGIQRYSTFFYQAYTELGYYDFVDDHLKDLLVAVPEPDNTFFAPKGVPLNYNGALMQKIHHWLVNEGDNILYIYGEQDTWSGAAVTPSASTNAVKMVKEGGWHATRIVAFDGAELDKIYRTLEEWLGFKVHPLAETTVEEAPPINMTFLMLTIILLIFFAVRRRRFNK